MNKAVLWGICGVATVGLAAVTYMSLSNKNLDVNNGAMSDNTNNGTGVETTAQKPEHKIYKYTKMSASVGGVLIYPSASLFGDVGEVSSGDIYYKPCIVAEFDTTTGKATKATFYAFFLDYEDDEWVNKAMEKYENSSSESKAKVTNVRKGRVSDNVSYLAADLDVNSYVFTQFIDTYIIHGQDIDKYKDEIFFSRLYNYSSEPPHSEGENFFEETLEGIRLEWSDTEFDPLSGIKQVSETTVVDDSTSEATSEVTSSDLVGE